MYHDDRSSLDISARCMLCLVMLIRCTYMGVSICPGELRRTA